MFDLLRQIQFQVLKLSALKESLFKILYSFHIMVFVVYEFQQCITDYVDKFVGSGRNSQLVKIGKEMR